MELIMEQCGIFTDAEAVFCNASWSYSVGTGYCIWINVTF